MLEMVQVRIGMGGTVKTGGGQNITPNVEVTFAVLQEENWDEAIQRACHLTHEALMVTARRMVINKGVAEQIALLVELGDTSSVVIEVDEKPDRWEEQAGSNEWFKTPHAPPLKVDPTDPIGYDA